MPKDAIKGLVAECSVLEQTFFDQEIMEGKYVEKTAQIQKFWHNKAGSGENTGAKCGNYSALRD